MYSTKLCTQFFNYSTSICGGYPDPGEYIDSIVIYTDGSCSNNGTVYAKAGAGVNFGNRSVCNISDPLVGNMQTSPRAELFAIVRALQTIAMVQAYCYQKRIIIYTDSRYCIDSITNWYKKWDRTGWINRRGKPVENKDYIQECRYYIDRLYVNVDLRYVPGHSGVIGNTIADDLACRGAHKPRNMVN